jgi:hypothetical protein
MCPPRRLFCNQEGIQRLTRRPVERPVWPGQAGNAGDRRIVIRHLETGRSSCDSHDRYHTDQ